MSFIGFIMAVPVGVASGFVAARLNWSTWQGGCLGFFAGMLAQAICQAAGLP